MAAEKSATRLLLDQMGVREGEGKASRALPGMVAALAAIQAHDINIYLGRLRGADDAKTALIRDCKDTIALLVDEVERLTAELTSRQGPQA